MSDFTPNFIPSSYIGTIAKGLGALVVVGLVGGVLYHCGQKSRDGEVEQLSEKLAENEKTVEIQKGLYSTTIVQMNGISNLLDGSRSEVAALKKQLAESHADLLSTQQLVVTWKKAYEGAVAAHQTDGGPSPIDPKVERIRVDFQKDFGPIDVSGYTLTSPPEGYVKIEQTRPLELTVNVARNLDGKWVSLVTSSDPNVQVGVNLGAVDLSFLDQKWYQRIWVEGGTEVLGDRRLYGGAYYQMDRWSVGLRCSVGATDAGCGASIGYRLFK